MGQLYEKLKAYSKSDYYGFHMPGHKRQIGDFGNPFAIDITEIDGFDDLHHPQTGGVLVQAQERAAALYASQETHFLVNGSTAGILSAILGCTDWGGTILVSRNCHRSVYHGIALNSLNAIYIYPQREPDMWINGSILPEDVDRALKEHPDIQAVVLTSPTYDGICSDLEKIGQITHKKGIPLLVDQAHGAHFPFHSYFPQDAVSQGVDVVIHSVHKTLPSLTQTALLHINGDLADRDRIRYYLSVFQTSSPSYILMASLDNCMEYLETRGKEDFEKYTGLLKEFHQECQSLKKLKVVDKRIQDGRRIWDMDLSRLLCSVRDTGWTGKQLGEMLLQEYHIQMEMNTCTYSLGISSVADTREGFDRLKEALFQLDRRAEKKPDKKGFRETFMLPRLQTAVSIETACFWQKEQISREKALGRIAGAFLYLYPPGIPLTAPGEVITEAVLDCISFWEECGMEIQGLDTDGCICVLKDVP